VAYTSNHYFLDQDTVYWLWGERAQQFDGRLLGYDIPLVVAWVRDPWVRHIFTERLAGRYEPVAEVHDYLAFLRRPPEPLATDDGGSGAATLAADGSVAADDAAAQGAAAAASVPAIDPPIVGDVPAVDPPVAAGASTAAPSAAAAPSLSQVLASPPRGEPSAPQTPSDPARAPAAAVAPSDPAPTPVAALIPSDSAPTPAYAPSAAGEEPCASC
jgi:hypothetical protein